MDQGDHVVGEQDPKEEDGDSINIILNNGR